MLCRGVDFSTGPEVSPELSPASLQFLSNIFDTADTGGDGLLGAAQLGQVFTTSPAPACDSDHWRNVLVRW